VNLDFADVKAVMSNRGNALMGTGRATGVSRAVEAAQAAVSSPLLEDVSITGAEGVLVNITGGRDLTLHEVNEAASVVVGAAGEEANVIFGSVIDPNLDGEIVITVIATGFGHTEPRLKLINQGRVAASEAQEEYRHPQPWKPREDQQSQQGNGRRGWGRGNSGRGESLEVPTFLRKQMD
jgi:cell division protein FtsZ